ncbi:peptidoglycan recognition protein-like [Plutella xylostella]|uniref:peptidoglycan recognition protein-like n=1 Tax=Plutella xylostella TaxID=51655 RepID=UPI0005D0A6E8|nr:peptidoglycan recognition protein-like [Plutella xylostella]
MSNVAPGASQPNGPAPRTKISVKERLSSKSNVSKSIICLTIFALIMVVIALIIYFTVRGPRPNSTEEEKKTDQYSQTGPKPWLVQTSDWKGLSVKHVLLKRNYPLKLVIINHSVIGGCTNKDSCSEELRKMQLHVQKDLGWIDIPYNFAIGREGHVYEARGWGSEGAHTLHYNNCSVGIGFFGNYNVIRPTRGQIMNLNKLLDDGVRQGYLDRNYVIVGHKDIWPGSESPGNRLYAELKKLPKYNAERYRNMNCTQIMEDFSK